GRRGALTQIWSSPPLQPRRRGGAPFQREPGGTLGGGAPQNQAVGARSTPLARHGLRVLLLAQGLALVVLLTPAAHAERSLGDPVLEVEVERDERQPLPLDLGGELADLAAV